MKRGMVLCVPDEALISHCPLKPANSCLSFNACPPTLFLMGFFCLFVFNLINVVLKRFSSALQQNFSFSVLLFITFNTFFPLTFV